MPRTHDERIKRLEARPTTTAAVTATGVGAQGPQGPAGATGAQGPAGPPGSSSGGTGQLTGGYAQATSNQSGITNTPTSVSGGGTPYGGTQPVRITVNIAENRWTLVEGYAQVAQLTSAGDCQVQIREVLNPGISTEIQAADFTLAANSHGTFRPAIRKVFSAGTHTFELQALTTAGTATIATGAGNDPAWIAAEDKGPFEGVSVGPQPPFTDSFTNTNGSAWASPWTTGTFTVSGHSGASTEDIQSNKGRMLLNAANPGGGGAILDFAKGAALLSDQEVYLELSTQSTLGSWFFDVLARDDGTAPTTVAQNAVGLRIDTAGTLSIQTILGGSTQSSVPKFVQSTNTTAGNPAGPVSHVDCAFDAVNAAGNHIAVSISWNNTSSTISAVTDTLGNTYNLANPKLSIGTNSQATYYAENVAAGTNVIHVGFSGSVPFPDVIAAEHSGILTSGSLDKTVAATGTSTSPDSGGVTTTQASEMLFGAIQVGTGVTTAGSGYTLRTVTVNHGANTAGGDAVESQIVSTTASYHATATQKTSAEWIAQLSTYKGSSVASTSISLKTSTTYGVRLNLSGLTYSAKIWDLTTTEPDWMVVYTDQSGNTPTSGTVRLQLVPQSGVSQRVDIDNFSLTDLSGTSVQLPDLQVVSLTPSITSPNVGDEVGFTALIQNVGSQATPSGVKVDVGIFVDPPDLSHLVADDPSEVCWNDNYAPTPGLAPGATQSLTTNSGPGGKATWTATGGNHNVYALIDTHNLITQEDAVSHSFLIALPVSVSTPVGVDVVPTGISTTPASPRVGDTVTFGGTVLNQGDTATPNGVNIKGEWSVDGGSTLATSTNYSPNPGLASSAVHSITSNSGSWVPTTQGTHQITLTLDSGNILGDTNRGDKTLTLPITVAPAPSSQFPLTVDASGRFLNDRNGSPYMLVADSPQNAIGVVNLTDFTTYVNDRAANGFTAQYIDCLTSPYLGGGSTFFAFDGTKPFTQTSGAAMTTASNADISKPVAAYWSEFDAFDSAIRTAGLQPVYDPIETGNWMPALRNAGSTVATNYGKFLGGRYKGVLWVMGNDFGQANTSGAAQYPTASDDALVQAVRDGIASADSTALFTVEFNQKFSGGVIVDGTSASDEAAWVSRINVDGAYTYLPTYDQILQSYAHSPTKPVFHIEGPYENSNFTFNSAAATTFDVRRGPWQAMSSGACGFFYGRGTSIAAGTYDTTGITHLGYLLSQLSGRNWQNLVPDGGVNGTGATLIVSGRGTYSATANPATNNWITAAKTPDKTFALIYLPQGGSPTINMAQMAGQTTVQFVDPTNNQSHFVTGTPFANVGNRTFTPPTTTNAAGDKDWVLILEAQVAPTGSIGFGFSNGYPLAYSNQTKFNSELSLSKGLGAQWYRGDVLSVAGNGAADVIVPLVGAAGLKFCAVLGGSSKALSPTVCQQIVAKYGPSSAYYAQHGFGIDIVEILNEPNCGTGALTGAAYWNIASQCITAIHGSSGDPAIPILVGAICNGGSTTTLAYAQAIVAASGTWPAGCHLSYHDYGSYSGLINTPSTTGTLRSLLDNNGMSDRLIYATEDGSFTGPGATGGQSQATQATFITNHINAWKTANNNNGRVGVWFCYQIRDVSSGDGVVFDNRGLYTSASVAKTAASAYANGVSTP